MTDALLCLRGLEAGYGGSQVLFGVDLDVGYGEVVSLLGRNGMGKTTTVLSIMGLLPPRAGEIRFAGRPMTCQPPFRIAQAGIGLVPEGRQVFPTLTVEENLIATASNRGGRAAPWTLERVYAFFPRLAERRRNYGDEISGGEQQMLAIGRALMTNPKLLLLDEATEGLAPLTRQEIWERLAQLKRDGLSILIIDKTIQALLRLSDRHVILEKGRIVWSGTSRALAADPATRDRYLSV
ncbi:MAG TPA: ABC transporter ATP-binding protein [Hyphomicrobiaceae bacterium]|nr:ABC transporter ATP-binding protein [Hyphomicrobiaceae bacterium]